MVLKHVRVGPHCAAASALAAPMPAVECLPLRVERMRFGIRADRFRKAHCLMAHAASKLEMLQRALGLEFFFLEGEGLTFKGALVVWFPQPAPQKGGGCFRPFEMFES